LLTTLPQQAALSALQQPAKEARLQHAPSMDTSLAATVSAKGPTQGQQPDATTTQHAEPVATPTS
jgi:hypothetical protein